MRPSKIWGGTAVETLAALTEKSLLRRREDPDGETRFWMLETIREYALEQAVSLGRLPGIAEQHALHQVLLSDRAAVGIEGPEQRYWLERIEHELPNVRGALEHLIGQGAPQAVQLAANLTRFWEIRSSQLEAKERLQAALDAAPPDSPHYARALGSAATIELMIGEPGAAVRHALAALEQLRPGETRLIERAHCHLGRAKWVLGDEPDPASTTARRSSRLARPRTGSRSRTHSRATRSGHRSPTTPSSSGRSSRRCYVFAA